MAFQKKKVPTYKYLTAGDRERLAKIDDDPNKHWCKFKYLMTLKKEGLSQEICIKVYGETEEKVKEHIAEHLAFFKKADEKWILASVKNLKESPDSENLETDP